MRKKMLKTLAGCSAALILLLQISNFSMAAVNSNISVITENAKKEELLGVQSQNNEVGILGIASKFSIFAKEDVTLKAADTNGKIAVGGKLEATTDYEYQVGCELNNYKYSKEAQIVCEKGKMKNIAVDFGWNGEKEETYSTGKIVAISSEFDFENSRESKYDTKIMPVYKYSTYRIPEKSLKLESKKMEYSTNNFREANLFKFENEFKYLEEQSAKLSELRNTEYSKESEVTSGKITINKDGKTIDSIIFRGKNKGLNVFNIQTEEFNNLIKATGTERALTFDVPAGSYVVINVTGQDTVNFDGSMLNVYYPMSNLEKDLYSNEKDDLGYLENNETVFRRISSGKNNDIEVENNETQAQYILYNVVESANFTINSNWVGTILAPKSNGLDNGLNGAPECGGHLSGTLICNSYEGYEQFGYVPFTLGLVNMDIDKIESENKEKLSGAELAIYYFETDENGDIVCNESNLAYKWTTTDETKSVILPARGYILKELNPPAGYEKQDNKYYVFEVKEVMNYSGNEAEYGTFSFENIVSEGHEYIKEEATYSTESNMWTPVTKSLHIAINMVNYVRV